MQESRTMLLSADDEPDLTRQDTRTWQPSRTATRKARAFQVVMCLYPLLALNLRRSFFVSGVAYHATGLKLSIRTPGKHQEHASVTMWDQPTRNLGEESLQPPKRHPGAWENPMASSMIVRVSDLSPRLAPGGGHPRRSRNETRRR